MHIQKTYDEWLIYRIRTGDKKAFKLLTDRWYAKLIHHIFFLVKNKDVAKDLAQDTWFVVLNKLHTVKEPASFKVWVYKIASNKAADWIKQEQRRRKTKEDIELIEYNSTYTAIDESDTDIKKLRKAFQKLPNHNKQILNLFYLESCSIREISLILKIPVGTVKSRLFNAREHLKNIINY